MTDPIAGNDAGHPARVRLSRHRLSRLRAMRASVSVCSLTSLVLAFVGASIAGADEPPPAPPPDPARQAADAEVNAESPLTVELDSGAVRGRADDATRQFLGIPYAAAPVGDLRWQPPQSVPHWDGIRDATEPEARCTQTMMMPTGSLDSGSMQPGEQPADEPSEDCLYLNVTTPRDAAADAPLPVMVWWHGGGFTTGAGSEYDAARMADQGNVIVVTVNYRLGVFGYFGLPGLPGSGNFGLADQFASLEWAQRNAGAFGGDPDSVTVFGESAGGMSTCAALTSPRAEGLIDKAIISSGSCMLEWPAGTQYPSSQAETPYIDVEQDRADGLALAREMGCRDDVLACMRDKPADELLPHTQDFANHLAYGTDLLPVDPADALAAGEVADAPVISGGNRDEGRAFVAGAIMHDPTTITPLTYTGLLQRAFEGDAGKVAGRYPMEQYGSAALAWATVVTDATWACPTRRGEHMLARRGPTYAYEFADPNAPNVNLSWVPQFPMGAAHATDLPYIFDLGGRNMLAPGGQQDLARRMIGYWTSFAHSGDPNHEGAPHWAPIEPDSGATLQLAPGAVGPVDNAAVHNCRFWDGLE